MKKKEMKKANGKRAALEAILDAEASIQYWNDKLEAKARIKRGSSSEQNTDVGSNASRKRSALKMKTNSLTKKISEKIFSQEKLQPSQDVIPPNNPSPKPMSQNLSIPATGKANANAGGASGTSALATVQGMQRKLAEIFMRSFLRYQKFFEAPFASTQPVLVPARTSDAVLAPVVQARVRAGSANPRPI